MNIERRVNFLLICIHKDREKDEHADMKIEKWIMSLLTSRHEDRRGGGMKLKNLFMNMKT